MGLLDVFKRKDAVGATSAEIEARSHSFFEDYGQFFFNGHAYALPTTMSPSPDEAIGGSLESLVHGVLKRNGPVAAAMFVRALIFSEARFVWDPLEGGEQITSRGLAPLRNPGKLLSLMMADADLAGNAFVVRGANNRPKRLRPDWVDVVLGSNSSNLVNDDAEVVAYRYQPGGPGSGNDPVFYLPNEVAHFAPLADPEVQWRGMSWITPLLSEISADNQATVFKQKFFKNAATPNLAVTLDVSDAQKFQEWVDKLEAQHAGAANAYKTLYMGAGASATPIGNTFSEMAFSDTISVAETRVAMVARVPATILGIGEGLQGSSLNAGNYGQARRLFADGTMRPLWRFACEALEMVFTPPSGYRLWYDDRDISFLQEDEADEAEIRKSDAGTIRSLVDSGFEPDSVVDAVISNDMKRLKHAGVLSVQLQPGTEGSPEPPDDSDDDSDTGDEDDDL